ncbi:MAG: hypothetical protein N2517_01325 [Ignavibacteria bacterium]|nr:hypothetical protein [Ignavibacteria bacterium]
MAFKERKTNLNSSEGYKNRLLKILLISFVVCSQLVLALVFILRLGYPYELEWMEGGTIEHILRLIENKSIFAEPSLEFIPYIYTPLFYYLGYLLSFVSAPSFFTLRLLAILSFVVSEIIIFKIVKDQTGDNFYAAIGMGLFGLSYSTTGYWFDIARVDTTANLFFILSFYFLIKEKKVHQVLSGTFAFLAFYTKQSYLFIHPFLLIALFFKNRRLSYTNGIVYFLSIAVSTAVEYYVSNGWYIFWNFSFPSSHHWILSRLYSFWTTDLLPFYSISLILCVFFFLSKSKSFVSSNLFLLALLFGTLINSYLLRLHYGGFLNVLIPFVTALSIVFPIAYSNIQEHFKSKEFNFFLKLLVFSQFLLLVYDPFVPIPREEDKKNIQNILHFVKNFDGDVYLLCHNFIQRSVGKTSYPHYVLVNDILISNSSIKEKFREEFVGALRGHKFKALLLDKDLKLDELAKYYYPSEKKFYHRVFNSRNSPIREEILWLPKIPE